MGPFKLLFFAGLIYLLYRMLIGSGSKSRPGGSQGKASNDQGVRDVLVEDPVCHALVPKGQAIRLYHEHQMYHFCSQQCCEKFLKAKERC